MCWPALYRGSESIFGCISHTLRLRAVINPNIFKNASFNKIGYMTRSALMADDETADLSHLINDLDDLIIEFEHSSRDPSIFENPLRALSPSELDLPSTEDQGEQNDWAQEEVPHQEAYIDEMVNRAQAIVSLESLSPYSIEILQLITRTADASAAHVRDEISDEESAHESLNLLFRLFRLLVNKNGLTPETFDDYYPCISVLTQLSAKPLGSTFTRELETLMQTQSEDALISRQDQLHEIWEQWRQRERFILSRKYFEIWMDEFVRRRGQYEHSMAQAKYVYRQNLQCRAIKNFNKKSLILMQMNDNADAQYVMSFSSRFLHKWLSRLASQRKQERKADYALKLNVFGKWQRRAGNIQDMSEVARNYDESTLKRRSLVCMQTYFNYLDAVEIEKDNLKGKSFSRWLTRSRGYMKQKSAIEEQVNSVLVAKYWKIWAERSNTLAELTNTAVAMDRKSTSDSYLQYWRRAYKLDVLSDELVSKYVRPRLLSQAFNKWRVEANMYTNASAFSDFMVRFRMFRYWRLRTNESVVSAFVSSRIGREKLKYWRTATKSQVCENNGDHIVKGVIFDKWVARVAQADHSENYAKSVADQLVAEKLGQKILQIWALRLRINVTMDLAARSKYEESLRLRFVGNLWAKRTLDEIPEMCKKADECFARTITTRVLKLWKDKLTSKKISWLNEVYSQVMKHRDEGLLKLTFDILRARHLAIMSSSRLAEQVEVVNVCRVAGDQLQLWSEKVHKIQEDTKLATEISDFKLRGIWFSRWRLRTEAIESAKEEADFIAEVRDLHRHERQFRVWKMRMFKLRNLERQAEDLEQQLQQLRFNRIWRTWKAKYKEAESTRASNTFTPGFLSFQSPLARPQIPHTTGRFTQRRVSLSNGPLTQPPANRMNTIPSAQSPPYAETPSRVLSKAKLPITSVERWRSMHAGGTPNRSGPQTPPRPFNLSSLRHVVTASATGSPERTERID